MSLKSKFSGLACALALAAVFALPARAQEKDIVDTAVAAGSFNTLAKALTAAGLVDTLKGDGPFTVFAPTDEAFAKLPAGTVEALLADVPTLKKVLLYHVVPGKSLPAGEVVKLNGKAAKTAEGSAVMVKVAGDKVMVDKANVVKTDVAATNGVIHVIDSVILPKGLKVKPKKM
jgi:uncharacterized surface protein with fasciclin (FAS1) repeats